MLTVQQILKDPKIKRFKETHQGAEEEIERAAQQLADKEDAITALRRLLPALDEKVVPVFFSYKKKDERAAKEIVKILRENSAERLDITYQADFSKQIAGRAWRQFISASIWKSNWFILLLPDPSDELDWCLFETGLFAAQLTSADRLICIHHPDTKVPDQIEGYQAVSAAIPDVEEFLKMVYVTENPLPGMKPINHAIEDQIPTLARQIVEAIRPPRKPYYHQVFEPWLEFKSADAARLESADQLDRAVIVDANREALNLFDFIDAPKTLGKLWSGLPKATNDSRWQEQLFGAVQLIANGRKFQPPQAVFTTKAGGVYRPIALAVDRLGDRTGAIETFHIIFTEDVAAVDHSKMPKDLSALATVLRFAFRFRWEVLEKFAGRAVTKLDVKRLDIAIRRMEAEWQSRGVGDQVDIENMFPSGKARERMKRMLEDWALIRNPQGTGELDVAIKKKNTKKIRQILKRTIPVNQEFLEMATSMFFKLIHGES
jgi:hypothetical protein